MSGYDAALAPITIGGVAIRNRIARAGHGTSYPREGMVSDQLIAYHEARARGGVGLTILEIASVHPSAVCDLHAWTDDIVPGWARLAERVHRHGMKVFTQLWHGGNNAEPPLDGGPPWSASSIPGFNRLGGFGYPPRAMTKSMIDEVVQAFARAAARARRAGLDGVEIHAAHGYLLAQFLSPIWNRREDEYGGSLDNRMRFTFEVLRAVRAQAGPGFAVGVRVTGNEWAAGGLGPAEAAEIARRIDASGLVDFIDVSAGIYQSFHRMIGPMYLPHGHEMADSVNITRTVRTPAIVTGRFLTLAEADAAIRRGDAAMVSMVRALIADPALVNKSAAGIAPRPCIGCNQGCLGGGVRDGMRWMLCTVNATAGHEAEFTDEIGAATPAGRVLIVGGGPAGLEAARVAALRGHRVELHEAAATLGGQARLAASAPGRSDLRAILEWLEAEIRRLGVTVLLRSRLDADAIRARGTFDAVLCATGPRRRRRILQLATPGLDVAGDDSDMVATSWDVLAGVERPQGHVVILDDVGNSEAINVAEKLMDDGCRVTVISRHGDLLPMMAGTLSVDLMRERLATRPFRFLPRLRLARIAPERVEVVPLDGGPGFTIGCTRVVPIGFHEPNHDLADALAGAAAVVRTIGDARTQRFLHAAIAEAHWTARAL
ncbi:MAG: FAD-dependent oxidoreductase [Gammaproteobacteria bacterium]